MITFLLCGFWHGSAWGFVIWGGIHGLFISIERIGLSRLLKKLPVFFSHLYLLFVVTVAWVFFRSPSVAESFTYIKALFGFLNEGSTSAFTSYYDLTYPGVALIAALAATPLPQKLRLLFMKNENSSPGSHLWRIAGLAVMLLLLAFSTFYLVNSTYSSFIYFKF
jgi:alginate O-acetyltransferase complex protein AlgI